MNADETTGLQVCLLLNVGNPRLDIKRVVLGPVTHWPYRRSSAAE